MTKRRYIPIRWVRLMLKRQDDECAVKGCFRLLILGPRARRTNFVVEHRHALGRGGKDILRNLELRCKEHADQKTFRPRSKATTIGGDIHEIRKTPRMRRKHKVRKPPLGTPRRARPKTTTWAKGRKLQSRGFSKVKRPMRKKA